MDIIVEVEKKVLVNIDGGRGPQGIQGIDGENGLSAYEIALENGFIGTEAEWLSSLQGADGDPASNLVTSVAGRQGAVVLTKADVALGNVDNTSDANKPISTATQTSLNLKVDKVAGERLINAAEITKLGNQSGVNTGDQDLSGLAVKANNLSDLTNAATARTNLGLGTLATQNGTFSGTSSGTNTGDQNDHGLMAGLGDDDHTQYMLLSGRVGGQTLIGGTAASNNLTLSSTSNITKGSIIFGDSRYNEATNRLSFGTASGTGRINLPDGGTTAADGIQFGTGTSNLYRSGANVLQTDGSFVILDLSFLYNNRFRSTNFNTTLAFDGCTGITFAPNTLTGSSATSALSISQTWNTTGIPTAIFANITNTASGASANLMDIQINNTSQFKISKTGLVSILQDLQLLNSVLYWNGGNQIRNTSNGILRFCSSGGGAMTRIQIGGTTSASPAIQINGNDLEFKNGNNSAFTATQSLYQRFGSGSPEGVVTAPVGAFYSRTDGGAGTSFYVKESGGSTSSGWVAK